MKLFVKSMPDPEVGPPYHLSIDKTGSVISATFTATGMLQVATDLTLPDGSPVYSSVEGIHTISTSTDLTDLHTRIDAADHTTYIYYIKDNEFVDPPVNIFAKTLPTRETPGDFAAREGYMTLFGIGMPSKEDKSADYMFVVVNTSSTLTLTGDLEKQEAPMTFYNQGMHPLILGAPVYNSSTQILSIPLSASDTTVVGTPVDNTVPMTVYVTTTVGNLLQSQIPLVNGTGTIYISLFGYPPGMTGKVKTAFKYWTRKAVTYFTTP